MQHDPASHIRAQTRETRDAGKALALPADLRPSDPAKRQEYPSSTIKLMSRIEEGKKGRVKRGRKRNFDLFIGSPNQLQTHCTALTLISFCSISSWVPLSSSHLCGIQNSAKQKVLPDTQRNKAKEASIFKLGVQTVGEGDPF